jgi:hypothetical protein
VIEESNHNCHRVFMCFLGCELLFLKGWALRVQAQQHMISRFCCAVMLRCFAHVVAYFRVQLSAMSIIYNNC